MICNEECNGKCNKQSACTCMCETNKHENRCNDCVSEESIEFSGVCKIDKFELNPNYNYWTELSLMGTIVVPEEKPSIEEVDQISVDVEILRQKTIVTPVSSTANYEGKKVTGKKLIIEGLLCVNASYVSLTPEQRGHSFHGQVPFSAFIVIPDSTKEYKYLIDKCIEEVCIKRVCERSIDLCAVLFLNAIPIQSECSTFVDKSGIDCNSIESCTKCSNKQCFIDKPDIKGICPKEKIETLLSDGGQEWTEVSIPELLTLPAAKPDIKQIVSVNSRIEIMCQKVIATPKAVTNHEGTKLSGFKLLVHALLKQRITYISTSECGSVHSAHYDMPVSAYIVLEPNDYTTTPPTINTNYTDKFNIKACIEDIYVCPLNERQIFKNTTLFLKAEKVVPC